MLQQFIQLLISGYQRAISPLMAPRCRFYPSCSNYAQQAIAHHGLLRGGALALWRILRCNPLSAGGMDPVPGSESSDHHCCHASRMENIN